MRIESKFYEIVNKINNPFTWMSMERPTRERTTVRAVLTSPGNPTSRPPPKPNPDAAGAV